MPKMIKDLPVLKTDAYKIAHMLLFPKGTEWVYSTLTPRDNSYFPYSKEMTVFGYQLFVERELLGDFKDNFFNQHLEDVMYTFKQTITSIMGKDVADKVAPHIEELHKLGYLPIKIKALPEGTKVHVGIPVLTIENTLPEFYWLPNYLETMLLSDTFVTSTVATTARSFRAIADKFARLTADDDSYVDFSFHDFSSRGQHGQEAASLSGIAHLTSFKGSDNLIAPLWADSYYTNIKDVCPSESIPFISGSVVASEHSVMQAISADTGIDVTKDRFHNQLETYRQLFERNPKGILSLVSDTYDYWQVVEEVLPALKDLIMSREGKVVLRPDSAVHPRQELVMTLESLWDTFGGTVNKKGYKVLDIHVGVIYGEGVTLDSVTDIMQAITDAGFSTENIVFGVGAYVYSVLTTRDTFAQALKEQAAKINGKEYKTFKKPFDSKFPGGAEDKMKTSHKGAVVVKEIAGKQTVIDNLTVEQANADEDNELQTIFEEGKICNKVDFDTVRARIKYSISENDVDEIIKNKKASK